jgi:hypothetical protein
MLSYLKFLPVLAAVVAMAQELPDHEPLTGALLAAQLRCEGLFCPQWALDISRYDTILYVNQSEPFEYLLSEVLPLAPTAQRSFHTYTTYDDATREMNVMATDYPIDGVDAYWVADVNDYVNATTLKTTYVLVPHPGTSPNSGGGGLVARFLLAPSTSKGGRRIVIFRDGCIHDVDLTSQKYTKIGSLFDQADAAAVYDVTDAHVFDGYILKSFIIDAQGVSYLVHTDFSSGSPVVSAPLQIQFLQGMTNNLRPIAAHMISRFDGDPARLVVINTGSFDQVNFVDEVTGEQEYIFSNLYAENMGIFMCNEDLKECDMWRYV